MHGMIQTSSALSLPIGREPTIAELTALESSQGEDFFLDPRSLPEDNFDIAQAVAPAFEFTGYRDEFQGMLIYA